MINLFSTPLWEIQVPDFEDLNHRLIAIAKNVEGEHRYFETDQPVVQELKNITQVYMDEISTERGWRPLKLKGRQNVIMPGGCDTPHNHPVSALTAVYYVTVPKNSGDILLHDPRGGIDYSWWNYNDRRRPFIRITPKEGTMLIFPGYLVHSVEANLSRAPRISIVIDAE
jgi:uncharacterized protein (TIGR02466 family)